jgi:DNA-binding MarR family transcriptional regulator
MDILKTCTSNIIEKEKIDLDLLKNTIDLLYLIEQDTIISETELTKKLKLDAEQIKKIINILAKKNYIKISKAQALSLYSLTEEGKRYFIKILRIFSDSNFKLEPNYYEKFFKKKGAPPFLGFMIADKDGKTLNTTEVYDGVFKEYIVPEYERTQADHELIPMFINALEKFAAEINIQNLTDFKLKGTNIKMQTFRYDFFTVTLFMNANTNTRSFKDEIYEWFNTLFKIHEREFQKSYYSGEVSSLLQIRSQWKKWLHDLNQKYNDLAINLNIFDIRQSVSLYEKLEKISRDFNIKYSIMIQKIKQLKKALMKAVYEENYHDIRTIAKDLSKLNL